MLCLSLRVAHVGQVAFVATGSSKAVAFGQIHHTVTPPDATLPCVRVKPVRECVWFVDADITRTMEDEIDRSSSAPFNPSSAGGAGGAK